MACFVLFFGFLGHALFNSLPVHYHYISTLEVCSRQGAIQIHVYVTLPLLVHLISWEELSPILPGLDVKAY